MRLQRQPATKVAIVHNDDGSELGGVNAIYGI